MQIHLIIVKQYSGNKEKVTAVIQRLQDLETLVSRNNTDASETQRRENLTKCVLSVTLFFLVLMLDRYRKLDSVSKELNRILSQNAVERIGNAAPDETAIAARVDDIRDALLDYHVRTGLLLPCSSIDSFRSRCNRSCSKLDLLQL